MTRHFVCVLFLIVTLFSGGGANAQVSLKIVSASLGVQKILTETDLMALPQVQVTTSNEYVDGEKTFSGPLVRDIFMLCGINATGTVRLIAVNEYQVDIAVEEFYKYDVILATSMDGVALTSRDKGPIWLIYPMNDHKELQAPVFSRRLIWQLVALEY